MLHLAALLFLIAAYPFSALANVEKVIFIAPHSIRVSTLPFDYANIDILSPSNPVLRTHLTTTFPSPLNPQGKETWYLLQHLHPSRRYELRICWPATVSHDFCFLFESMG